METFDAYTELALRGGFRLISVRNAQEPMMDALNRPALARTAILGLTLEMEIAGSLSADELSITLYHEVLEAVTVAARHPPPAVRELNEVGFESTARRMNAELGPASPAALNRMLELFGF